MGAVIAGIHEIDAVLSVVMDMATQLVDGEVGAILFHDGEKFVTKTSWGITEKFLTKLTTPDEQSLVEHCYSNGAAIILTDLQMRNQEGLSVNSAIALPIKTSDRKFGVLVIVNKAQGGNFTEDDQEILEMLLNFVAVAVDNSLLMIERLERQKTEQEMAIARQVQETILPQGVTGIAGVEVGAIYYPARAVGGDFYDIIRLDDQTFIAIIGDVSNKGVPAALVMSASAGIIKAIIKANPTIAMDELASTLNELLASEIVKDREMFVTLLFVKFDLARQAIFYCNAGHLPGLFWDESERVIEPLPTSGPIVGQFPGAEFKQSTLPIASGDRLFLFTDGLTEAMDAEGKLFGRERAEQVFVTEIELSPRDFCVKVKEWVDNFAAGASEETHDDFTILQVRIE
jgi:sigma-B regulation protein RsbU (phosphoserine phosphatase)